LARKRNVMSQVRGHAEFDDEDDERFHGLHVAAVRAKHEKIKWLDPTPRSDRLRVRMHTCECHATIYELCSSGGLQFIRRSTRGPSSVTVHESERLIAARADDLWLRLLVGEFR
jgi:hypothetical protein